MSFSAAMADDAGSKKPHRASAVVDRRVMDLVFMDVWVVIGWCCTFLFLIAARLLDQDGKIRCTVEFSNGVKPYS